MWMKIMLLLCAWFAGALALGILGGKSMALGNRIGRYPDDSQDEFDEYSPAQSRDLLKLHESHSVDREPVFPDLQPAKR